MRDISIDVTRGLAIFMMIAANTVPYLLAPPAPLGVRLYSSFAAPIFITFAGMMVALTKKRHSLGYFITRGGTLVLIGVLIDVFLWGDFPFVGMDVLYLIGIALPLTYLFLELDEKAGWAIIAAVFLLTAVFQSTLGYREIHYLDQSLPAIARSMLIDGYFPIFPWIGFSLLGAQFGRIRWKEGKINKFNDTGMIYIFTVLLLIGAVLWAAFPGNLYIREGYVEMFYPPTLGFIIATIGVILFALFVFDTLPWSRLLDPFRAMGEWSLQIYVAHLAVIALLIKPLEIKVGLPVFILIYLVFAAAMYLLSLGLRTMRMQKSKQKKSA